MAVNHLRKHSRTNNTTASQLPSLIEMEWNLLVMFSSSKCVLPPVPSPLFLFWVVWGPERVFVSLDFLLSKQYCVWYVEVKCREIKIYLYIIKGQNPQGLIFI